MISKEKNFVSIIFYVRNSEKYIGSFLHRMLTNISNKFDNFELICVNNDSKDTSVQIVKEVASGFQDKNAFVLNIINLSECISFEEAISIGIQLAIGDFIFEFDTPLIDYDEDLIIEAYNKMLSDVDIVAVSPNKKPSVLQKLYYALYNFGVSRNKRIYPERFRMISRRAINRVTSISKSYELSVPIYKNCGLNTYNIFYKPNQKHLRYDKEEFRERMSKGIETIMMYTCSIQKIMLYIAAFFFLIGFGAFLANYMWFGIMLSVFSVMFLIGCVIVHYLSMLLKHSYRKNIQMIKSIEKVVK